MLLTNLDASNPPSFDRIPEIYPTRWKHNENYRFTKQAYHLEDIRSSLTPGYET